jgi:hypothetical protein
VSGTKIEGYERAASGRGESAPASRSQVENCREISGKDVISRHQPLNPKSRPEKINQAILENLQTKR